MANTYSDKAIKDGVLFDGIAVEAFGMLGVEPETWPDRATNITAKSCDCLWYAIEMCWSLGFDLKQMARDVNGIDESPMPQNPKFSDIQCSMRKSPSNEYSAYATCLSLAAGNILDAHKRMIHEDCGRWTRNRLDTVRIQLGILINTIIRIWTILDIDAEDMCDRMISRVAKRTVENEMRGGVINN